MTTAFLDKDGTLVEDVPYNVDPARIELVAAAPRALRLLGDAGCRIVVVTNQSGVARGLFPESALEAVRERLSLLLALHGARLDGFYYCPHLPHAPVARYARVCPCRKPADGMLRAAASDLSIDLADAWLIGDILDDIEAGRRAGCRTVLVDAGHETEWHLSPRRVPEFTVSDLEQAAETVLSGARRAPAAPPRGPAR
ncbi:MAG: D-glycero-alpha-D-manno-heptose-1,7-bisphosphate 7-phosphatase [Dehalococcoidia bacterium]